MVRGKSIFILVLLGLVSGFAQSLASQSVERTLDQTSAPSVILKVARVWARNEVAQQSPPTSAIRLGQETLHAVAGSIFFFIDFVLMAEEATINLALADSSGMRYRPIGTSPFSASTFYFFSSKKGSPSEPLSVHTQSSLGGKIDVWPDQSTKDLTFRITKPGTQFTAVWVIPQERALRPSEFKLYIGNEEPIPIDTLASVQESILLEAATSGNEVQVMRLLEEGGHVDVRDNGGWTPLHWMVRYGHNGGLKLLLAKGADVNAKDNKGWTPLHRAAFQRDAEAAKLLLDSGAEVEAKNFRNQTPLHQAARENAAEVAALLLAKGAHVDERDELGTTPLHESAIMGATATAELLLANGAEVNIKDSRGKTPLHWAAFKGTKGVAELLLTKGAHVNERDSQGRTPLHEVANSFRTELAELLLANGAEVNAKDNAGKTPLDLAQKKAIKDLLRKRGAK